MAWASPLARSNPCYGTREDNEGSSTARHIDPRARPNARRVLTPEKSPERHSGDEDGPPEDNSYPDLSPDITELHVSDALNVISGGIHDWDVEALVSKLTGLTCLNLSHPPLLKVLTTLTLDLLYYDYTYHNYTALLHAENYTALHF